MSFTEVDYKTDGHVAIVTLNRPESLNAWTSVMGNEVRQAMRKATDDANVRVIVVTGAGRGFCAGADMKRLSNISNAGRLEEKAPPPFDPNSRKDFQRTNTYFPAVPKPIIAAINGPVAGMAVPIALACDLRFMASDAVLTVAFSQRGLVAEWGIGWLLPRLVGSGAALDLLFSSRKVDGTECERLGLVNRAVDGDVVAVARSYIEELAEKCSPTSLAVMKRQVYQGLHAGLGPKEREAQQLMVESFGRPDFGEGVQSFLQKRPPKFQRLPADS